jgi:predicted amidohydrolase YtcJ
MILKKIKKHNFVKLYVLGASVVNLFFLSCSSKKPADLIVTNAVVYTVDSSFSTVQSFAVKDGKFIAVGTNEQILSEYESANITDAGGNPVYPGFIDSHCHFYGYGEGLQEVDLTGTTSFEQVINKVKEGPSGYPEETRPPGEWIIGRGWDQNDWAIKEYPDRFVLDSLFPDNPVLIERVDGHAALANGAALKLANISTNTKISGGAIEQTNGKLTGILIDNAVDLVKKVIPKPSEAEIKTSLLAAQKNCFEVGLTTVDDAGLEKKVVDVIDAAQKSGDLKMRIYAMLSDNKENVDHYYKTGPYKTERLNVCSFKFYADGALGSRGACLREPYTDKPGSRGFLLDSIGHFVNSAHYLSTRFQINTHCIGDSAVGMMLDIFRQLSLRNARWRIEHFQVTTAADIQKLKMICQHSPDAEDPSILIPSVQPTHATSDMYWAKDRLGPERIKYAYAYNYLLNACGMIALGTDFPVENINPMYTFYAAVVRKDLKGFPEGGFQMENALSRENTLRGMTIWGAYANFEEREKGSIEPGKFADFVILENDIMKCGIDKVPTTKVKQTFVGGECVFSK